MKNSKELEVMAKVVRRCLVDAADKANYAVPLFNGLPSKDWNFGDNKEVLISELEGVDARIRTALAFLKQM